MSKNHYYEENKKLEEDRRRKEILAYWSDEKTYKWLEKEQPNYQLIEAIILKYDGISSPSIAYLYNNRINPANPINEYIINHILDTCNKYKCTFNVLGEYVKKNELWYYNVDPNTELRIREKNPFVNEKKQKTKEYILSLENKIKVLENELINIKAKGVSQ